MQTETAANPRINSRTRNHPSAQPIYAARRGRSNPAYCATNAINLDTAVSFNLKLAEPTALEKEARESAFNEELKNKSRIVITLCALDLVTETELNILVDDSPITLKESTLASLLTNCHIKANQRLAQLIEGIKSELVSEGFDKEFVEQAILKSEMEVAFTPHAQTYLAYTEAASMKPVIFCCNRLPDGVMAAQKLVSELAVLTGSAMIDDAMGFGYGYGELPALTNLSELTALCSNTPDFSSETDLTLKWLGSVSDMLLRMPVNMQSEVDELLSFRTDENIQVTTIANIKAEDIGELEQYGFLSALSDVLRDIEAFSVVHRDMEAVRNCKFSDCISKESEHYDFLSRVYRSIESLKAVETAGMHIVNDAYGCSYFFTPSDYTPKWAAAYDMLDEIIRCNMEADEWCTKLDLNDPTEGVSSYKKHLKGVALTALLDWYLGNLPNSNGS